MSDERKIRDLMARLVSMSPEPPPYPEETQLARQEARRRPKPALVFATAAALVALLAVPLLLFTGDGAPIVAGTSTTTTTASSTTVVPDTTSTTIAGTSTTSAPATTTTEELLEPWSGVVFLYQEPENSFLENPALVPVSLEVVDPSGQLAAGDDFTEALASVAGDLPSGMSNLIPPQVRVQGRSTEDGVITVDMNDAFLDGAGGFLADVTMLNQLVYTLTYGSPESRVLFTVDGRPVEAYGSDGLVLTDPVGRDDYRDQLGLIFLTEPLIESNGVYPVAGLARTFEGNLTVRVLGEDGTVTHEEPVQAACGDGCWGDFQVEIVAGLIEPGISSIRLFTYSAEDGSVVEAITIPIPEAVVWKLTAG